ncbi:DUF1292 domain-containing protein [Aquibacillus sediminis]|uniref:DUF1292 domain-containing protein n=1 Tax=Aquibacillus sediminis TaxID=2574734 RepID=UPI001108FA02|nr:DUF1292 domain-containing protein [Aquibacillus sediminis]
MKEQTPIEELETLTIEDEQGNETTYQVDAVIEMNNKQYILYSHDQHMIINEIVEEDGEERLEDITEQEMQQIYDAYQQAIEEEVGKNE